MQVKKRYGISGFLGYKAEIGNLVIIHPGFNGLLMKVMLISMLVMVMLLASAFNVQAQTVYCVRAGATGTNNGSDWNNAFTTLPATLVRGATYYIADGKYAAYKFDDPVSGTSVITIKKATASDHGTNTGWRSTYGDGQAVFANYIQFETDWYVFDGNGTHTIPSSNTDDYGFKIYATSVQPGVIRFGRQEVGHPGCDHITVRYTHVYNEECACKDGGNGGARSLYFYTANYIKMQYCFLERSQQDGIVITSSTNLLFENCYMYQLGQLNAYTGTNYHGQTVMIFYGPSSDIIFRNNIWRACQGQALIQCNISSANKSNIRFYGNVVFNHYNTVESPGFYSGGIISCFYGTYAMNGYYVYNNTFVNIGGDNNSSGSACASNRIPYPAKVTASYFHNNLFYNCHTILGSKEWDSYSYQASGGGDTAGGTNEQTGLGSSIFQSYTGNDFRLTGPTSPAKTLPSEKWWSGGVDSFFGTIDSAVDMYGNTRGADGTWDRGAFEYGKGEGVGRPLPPAGLRIFEAGKS